MIIIFIHFSFIRTSGSLNHQLNHNMSSSNDLSHKLQMNLHPLILNSLSLTHNDDETLYLTDYCLVIPLTTINCTSL